MIFSPLEDPGDTLLTSAVPWRRATIFCSTLEMDSLFCSLLAIASLLYSILVMSFSPLQYPGDELLSSAVHLCPSEKLLSSTALR